MKYHKGQRFQYNFHGNDGIAEIVTVITVSRLDLQVVQHINGGWKLGSIIDDFYMPDSRMVYLPGQDKSE